jgi:phage host-nuclease inhibitor protein Gam
MSRPAARLKTDACVVKIPQSKEDVIDAIAAIGRHQRERIRIEAAMNDELAQVRESWEKQAAPHLETIRSLTTGVHLWCEANRAALTQDGKVKYAHLASGDVKWRMTPPKVTIRVIENVLETLKQLGLTRLIRVKEEVNKEAVLAEPETVAHIKGIVISQKEEFIVQPFETELEEVA